MAPDWTIWTYSWTALAFLTFVVLLVRTAPYGRHKAAGWGPDIPHRVGWIIMEAVSPLMLILVGLLVASGNGMQWTPWHLLLFGAWIAHYLYRAFWYPFLMRWENRRMPLVIMFSAITFNLINGGLNGSHLAARPALELTSPLVLLGGSLFLLGLAINVHADAILRSLRKPGETGYRIPERGLYRWVSCPNYLGEMMEWIGFALMALTPAAIAFAVWTIANLLPRALAHHRWYREEFPMYPASRRAVVPFIVRGRFLP